MIRTWLFDAGSVGEGLPRWHSSILAWRIPRTEEPSRLQFIGSLSTHMLSEKGNLGWSLVLQFQSLSKCVTSIVTGKNEEHVFRGKRGSQLWICWPPGNIHWTVGHIGLEVWRSWNWKFKLTHLHIVGSYIGLEVRRSCYWKFKLIPICIWLVVT